MLVTQSRIVLFAAAVGAAVLHAQVVTRPAASRFLDQSTWGPTPDSVAHVMTVGFAPFIDEQVNALQSQIPDVPLDGNGRAPLAPMQQRFFFNAATGIDQLRQRVAFALSQIWVVSGLKLNDATQMVPYLRLLQADAFENYRKIMYDVTLSPAMGRYLDMVNNDKPDPAKGTGANENYARELLQLFTIGLSELNQDGTLKLGTSAKPIPTYNQDQIEGFARAFTGWTYAPKPGVAGRNHNPAYFAAPMIATESLHDTTSKPLLNGVTLPRGQTAVRDLNDALDNIFNHPNVGPFIGRQLIQHLVMSNPSPAYVERISRVFANNGQNVRGDMRAVIKAILLDPEARGGDNLDIASGEGHLREPVLFMNGVLRAVAATVGTQNSLPQSGSNMGQNVYLPASVFNYFPPDYKIEGSTINAPEFAILSPATAMTRVDFLNTMILNQRLNGVTIDFGPWAQLAPYPQVLMETLGAAFFRGQMPADVRNKILAAVGAATTNTAKAQTALYLAASSALYQVER